MVQSPAETLTEAAQADVTADHQERDREAWNLPRASTDGAYRAPLDWDGFRDLYYPDSRRHNLEAIVAYGAYKRSSLDGSRANEATSIKAGASPPEALSLDEWEDEGGTSP
jgi:hypothetical protein